jgi:hypothetical protein
MGFDHNYVVYITKTTVDLFSVYITKMRLNLAPPLRTGPGEYDPKAKGEVGYKGNPTRVGFLGPDRFNMDADKDGTPQPLSTRLSLHVTARAANEAQCARPHCNANGHRVVQASTLYLAGHADYIENMSPPHERKIQALKPGDGRKFSWATQRIHDLEKELEKSRPRIKVSSGSSMAQRSGRVAAAVGGSRAVGTFDGLSSGPHCA